MARRDYYKILGVSKGATDAEIKRAYRRLARQLHPDVTGDDPRSTERFKEITEAYEVLSDPKRRRSYDLFGPPESRGRSSPMDAPPFQAFADLFDEVLRRTQKKGGPEPGVDVERTVTITLAEAVTGCEKTVDVDLERACAACEGRGHPKDKPPEACPACDGSGNVPGVLLKRACPRCDGTGRWRRYTCRACAGEGIRREPTRLKVVVPAGVDTGTRLRLKGQGEVGRGGGPPGDLYAVIEVKPDPRFDREGSDLRTEVKLGIKDALLGARVEVPLPEGSAVIQVPAGTQGGQVFRLKGKGVPRLAPGAPPGDIFVTVQLRVPRSLPPDARALVERLAETVPDL